LWPGEGREGRGGGDGVGDEPRVCDLGEQDERGPGRKALLGRAGELQREPGLPRSAGAGEGQQPGVVEQRRQLRELASSSDERARVDREPARTIGWAEPGELLAELRDQLGELLPAA